MREVVTNATRNWNGRSSDLQLAEFIYEQPAVGDVEYTFKHALTLEVAYSSLLSSGAAACISALARGSNPSTPISSTTTRPNWPATLIRSGERANATSTCTWPASSVARSAFHEAFGYAARGLELVGRLPESPSRAERELGCESFSAELCIGSKVLLQETGGRAGARQRTEPHTGNKASELCPHWRAWLTSI